MILAGDYCVGLLSESFLMDKSELANLRLSVTGVCPEMLDTFFHTFCKANTFVRTPLLNTGVDSDIQSVVLEARGIVVLLEARQIADWMMKWLLTVCHKPILLFAICSSRTEKAKVWKSGMLSAMLASLRSSGIDNVRIELLYFYPDLLTFGEPEKVDEILETFSCAASHFNAVPEVIFSCTPEEVETYFSYCNRIREEAKRFVFLRNMLDVTAVVHVCKEGEGWNFSVEKLSSNRLDVTDDKLMLSLQTDLSHASVCNSTGYLMPLQIQMAMSESLNRWLRSKNIGAICDLKLTLKCPDEATRFSIQQSPITIEVEK
jgi:hypothetical protein